MVSSLKFLAAILETSNSFKLPAAYPSKANVKELVLKLFCEVIQQLIESLNHQIDHKLKGHLIVLILSLSSQGLEKDHLVFHFHFSLSE